MMHSETLLKDLESGSLDLKDHITKQLERSKKYKKYNAFVTINDDVLTDMNGPSIAIKDNIITKGLKSTSSSKVIGNYIAPYDATVVKNIKNCFSVIGKTANDPFGAGGSGSTSDFGSTKNPFDATRVPGGSSGGNGVALALNMCDFALGSDTFGSVRAPASFCGVVGFRPSYGLVSRYGLMDLSMSIDTIGPMARDVYGVAYLLSLIAGHDKKDLRTEDIKIPKYHEHLEDFNCKKLKFVIPKDFFDVGIDKKVVQRVEGVVELLESFGMTKVELKTPKLKYSVPIYYLSMFAEFSSAMQKYDGMAYGLREEDANIYNLVSKTRGEYLNRELKRRILLGTYITLKEYRSKWYTLALNGMQLIKKELSRILKNGDFIITPTMPSLPWKIGEITSPVKNYMMDLMTGPPSIGGLPAVSVPCGKIGKMPVGVQFIGRRLEDLKVLQLAHLYEKNRGELK